jgi:hypothetical protein
MHPRAEAGPDHISQAKKQWIAKKKTPAFLHGVFRRGENAPPLWTV